MQKELVQLRKDTDGIKIQCRVLITFTIWFITNNLTNNTLRNICKITFNTLGYLTCVLLIVDITTIAIINLRTRTSNYVLQ